MSKTIKAPLGTNSNETNPAPKQNFFKKLYEKNKDKIKQIKIFVLIMLGYGILINYALFVIFKIPFTWYGFPAFGVFYYFITEELVTFFRKIKEAPAHK
jgi:hypothetical protein